VTRTGRALSWRGRAVGSVGLATGSARRIATGSDAAWIGAPPAPLLLCRRAQCSQRGLGGHVGNATLVWPNPRRYTSPGYRRSTRSSSSAVIGRPVRRRCSSSAPASHSMRRRTRRCSRRNRVARDASKANGASRHPWPCLPSIGPAPEIGVGTRRETSPPFTDPKDQTSARLPTDYGVGGSQSQRLAEGSGRIPAPSTCDPRRPPIARWEPLGRLPEQERGADLEAAKGQGGFRAGG
jgi:hypothetical protein